MQKCQSVIWEVFCFLYFAKYDTLYLNLGLFYASQLPNKMPLDLSGKVRNKNCLFLQKDWIALWQWATTTLKLGGQFNNFICIDTFAQEFNWSVSEVEKWN